MDRQLRDAERLYQTDSTTGNLIKLLNVWLRGGQPIELTHDLINNHWEDPELRNFLSSLPKTKLQICNHELVKPLATRTFLLAQLRRIIADDFNFLFYDQDLEEARHACDGEFSIAHTAFSPNGEGAGSFFIITLFNDGFVEHYIEFECDDDPSQWGVTPQSGITTEFVDYWDAMYCNYNESCGPACNENHIGTEEHVFEIDARRADEVAGHFNARLREGSYEEFIDLKLQGY